MSIFETARKKVRLYFSQIIDGCGSESCTNENCGSSKKLPAMSKNEAAALALKCCLQDSLICSPLKDVAKPTKNSSSESMKEHDYISIVNGHIDDHELEDEHNGQENKAIEQRKILVINEEQVRNHLKEYNRTGNCNQLCHWIVRIFNDSDSLQMLLSNDGVVDLNLTRRFFSLLSLSIDPLHLSLVIDAFARMCSIVVCDLTLKKGNNVFDLLTIAMELPILQEPEFVTNALSPFCRMYHFSDVHVQQRLVFEWATRDSRWLLDRVQCIQQGITMRILTRVNEHQPDWLLEQSDDEYQVLASIVHLLGLFHRASLLGGRNVRGNGPDMKECAGISTNEKIIAEMYDLSPWDVRTTLVAHDEFINEILCQYLDVEDDYIVYKNNSLSTVQSSLTSILPHYAFVATSAIKLQFISFENRIRMLHERHAALATTLETGFLIDPFLRIFVQRNDLVNSALDVLNVIAATDPQSLRKQLRVKFEGEQGVDAGGVSKEFYQMITEELFSPDYGMFVHNDQTRLFWFNRDCTDCSNQYLLIGILFGLAIYNQILIDVRFPLVLYRKLFGKVGEFADLQDIDPPLHHGLTQLLEYPQNDVETVFCYSFRISYKDVYGNQATKLLKPDGDEIAVSNGNRQEFVDLYADFLLNRSIAEQFNYFDEGFKMVVDQSMLTKLCLPEEVEQFVSGVSDLDMTALQRSTRYEGGFYDTCSTVLAFWAVVHSMDDENKRLLLQFSTGCDRTPVGGLSRLEFVLVRNGDDQSRLPTAHTCYNVLLLPAYESEKILSDRLLKAISYSRGFGLH